MSKSFKYLVPSPVSLTIFLICDAIMLYVSSSVTNIAAYALKWLPAAQLKSWLLCLSIQTHFPAMIDSELKHYTTFVNI